MGDEPGQTGTVRDPDSTIIGWNDPDDPDNPKNWPNRRKWMITVSLGMLSWVVTFASSIFSTATRPAAKEFGVSVEVMTLGTSLFVLGFAFGPLVFGPMSEVYGRKYPLFVGYFVFAIFQIPVATAENVQTVLVCRFLSGLFGSSPLSVVGGALVDLWPPVELGIAMSIFAGANFIGPVAGPIMGGFITQSSLGWRWTAYITAIMAALFGPIAFMLVPETLESTLLSSKARSVRLVTRDWAMHAVAEETPVDISEMAGRILIRPLAMLALEPVIILVTLYMSFVYGLIYLCFEDSRPSPANYLPPSSTKLSLMTTPPIKRFKDCTGDAPYVKASFPLPPSKYSSFFPSPVTSPVLQTVAKMATNDLKHAFVAFLQDNKQDPTPKNDLKAFLLARPRVRPVDNLIPVEAYELRLALIEDIRKVLQRRRGPKKPDLTGLEFSYLINMPLDKLQGLKELLLLTPGALEPLLNDLVSGGNILLNAIANVSMGTSKGTKVRRDGHLQDKCLDLDGSVCVVTGASNPQACHIIPFSWSKHEKNLKLTKRFLPSLGLVIDGVEAIVKLQGGVGYTDRLWNMAMIKFQWAIIRAAAMLGRALILDEFLWFSDEDLDGGEVIYEETEMSEKSEEEDYETTAEDVHDWMNKIPDCH
ncbi:major facilitator superfamily transporter [Fusarium bulbicola]|nr:major facilitator superfamily transporter [Fusarium bulbicola]